MALIRLNLSKSHTATAAQRDRSDSASKCRPIRITSFDRALVATKRFTPHPRQRRETPGEHASNQLAVPPPNIDCTPFRSTPASKGVGPSSPSETASLSMVYCQCWPLSRLLQTPVIQGHAPSVSLAASMVPAGWRSQSKGQGMACHPYIRFHPQI